MGKVEFSWVANGTATSDTNVTTSSITKDGMGDVEMGGAGDGDGGTGASTGQDNGDGVAPGKGTNERREAGGQETREVDYDVAEDEDEWIS